MKSTRAHIWIILAVGGVIGYIAACDQQSPKHNASADPPASNSSAQPARSDAPSKVADSSKPVLLAQGPATPAVLAAATAQVEASGKKPNILVIMGDDVGWFNIGAYHRASCPARRRTSTSSPREGMMFTDYYAEASCTAGRANFITGELPLRTGLTTVGQAGADVGLPGQGLHARHRAQGAGLRHRPVRQEPPRRLEQVPADGARLRRVLRLPVSPRRHVRSLLVRLSPGLDRQDRPARPGALLGDGHRRPHRAAALGQDRQAEDRGRRPAWRRSPT